ncbi:MAG: RNA polymerase sigma factor [Pirellulaceae bacterium]
MQKPANSQNDKPQGPIAEQLRSLEQHRDWLVIVSASRLKGNRTQAEEIVSELFLEIASGNRLASQVEHWEPWLHRATVNRTIDWIRSQKRHELMQREYAEYSPVNSGVDSIPIELLIAKERSAEIRQVLNDLPPDDLEILLLKYAQAWSYQAIGSHLGLSFTQVTYRLRQARSRLKQELSKSEFASDFQTTDELKP